MTIGNLIAEFDAWSADREDLAERASRPLMAGIGSDDDPPTRDEWNASDDTACDLAGRLAEALRATTQATRIVLDVPGMDDCDQATLLGILRDALDTERGRDFLARGFTITATTTPVMAAEPHVTTWTPPTAPAEPTTAPPRPLADLADLTGRTVAEVTERELMARDFHDHDSWVSWTETTLHFTDGSTFVTQGTHAEYDPDTVTAHGLCDENGSASCMEAATHAEADETDVRVGYWCDDHAEQRAESGAVSGHVWYPLATTTV